MTKRALHASDTQTEKHITQSAIHAHEGAKVFLPKNQFVAMSDGSDDAGKGILLDSNGLIDPSMLTAYDTFLKLGDTPSSYSGEGGKYVRVNSTPDGLEFVIPTFLELSDTPSVYTGEGGKLVQVNSTPDGLEFTNAPEVESLIVNKASLPFMEFQEGGAKRGGIYYNTSTNAFIIQTSDAGSSLRSRISISGEVEDTNITLTPAAGGAVSFGLSEDAGQVAINAWLTLEKGASLQMFGASHATYPGHIYIDYGDYSATKPSGTKLTVRLLDNSTTLDVLSLDENGRAVFDAGGDDGAHLSLSNTDVVHGVTGVIATNIYGWLEKITAAEGGLRISGITESTYGLAFTAYADVWNTTKASTARALIEMEMYGYSGTAVANVGDNANLFAIRARKAGSLSTIFLIDEDGNAYTFGNYYLPKGASVRELSPIVQCGRTVLTLTWDNTVRTLDLTSDTSAYARWALIHVAFWRTSDYAEDFYWYEYNETSNHIVRITSNQIGSSNFRANGCSWLPLDSEQRINYKAPSSTSGNEVILFGYIEGTN